MCVCVFRRCLMWRVVIILWVLECDERFLCGKWLVGGSYFGCEECGELVELGGGFVDGGEGDVFGC